jgi:two-component system CheB/CheR fusion protein
LIDSVFKLFQKQALDKGLNFLSYIDSNIPDKLVGDPSRLRQILLNLVGNAIKFTKSGSVNLSVFSHSLLAANTERIQDQQPIIELMIAIQDTGIGIDHDHLTKMFQPFSQADASINRKYGGTGLGLAISKSLVELMGGTIWVESLGHISGNPPHNWRSPSTQNQTQGATFYLTLKLEQAFAEKFTTPEQLSAPELAKINQLSSLRIILAEDNVVNQKVALFMLKKFGCHVDIANNGIQVLALLEKQTYDVILMDVQMPEMDGLTATKMIRQSSQYQPYIIALTANALDEDQKKCLDVGMNDYLRKPIILAKLTDALEKFLNSQV